MVNLRLLDIAESYGEVSTSRVLVNVEKLSEAKARYSDCGVVIMATEPAGDSKAEVF